MFGLQRPIKAFQECTTLAELFEEVKPYKIDYHALPVMHAHNIGGYCAVRNGGDMFPHSFAVKPTAKVIEFIRTRMFNTVNLSVCFEIIIHDDDTFTVHADYDHIIGGRWLAELPLSELASFAKDKPAKELVTT